MHEPSPPIPRSLPAAPAKTGRSALAAEFKEFLSTPEGREVSCSNIPAAEVFKALVGSLGGLSGAGMGVNEFDDYLRDFAESLAPRDAIERQLIQQLAWAHVRLARLNALAAGQQGLKQLKVLHELTDRAAATYRKTVACLDDRRRGPRPRVVNQTNVAGQQIVQNQLPGDGHGRNEKGLPAGAAPAPALLPEPAGLGVPAVGRPPREAVGEGPRAGDAAGQGPLQPQQLEARLVEPG